ncbi:MAG: hypothetical protein ACRC6V_09380 [Bacteroidales bacterium]
MSSSVLNLKSQLKFGKYNGFYVDTVLKLDPKWVLWVSENTHHRFGLAVLKRAHQYADLMEKPEY